MRFATKLEFGEKTHEVTMTVRICEQKKNRKAKFQSLISFNRLSGWYSV